MKKAIQKLRTMLAKMDAQHAQTLKEAGVILPHEAQKRRLVTCDKCGACIKESI